MTEVDAIELTRQLVGIDTLNPPGNEREAARLLGSILEAAGFQTTYDEFAPDRFNIVARFGPTTKRLPLCFSGHLDTVPLGARQWKRSPFAGKIEDGKIYGRGTSDMKSGLAAMMVAALRVVRLAPLEAGLLMVFTGGEETGCTGAKSLAAAGILGTAGALVVGEPTSNAPLIGHKGAFWLEAVTHGVAAHGSMPEQGVNAIHKAARAVLALAAFDFGIEPHGVLGAPTLNVGTIRGGINVNSVPDEARIGIDIRTVPGLDHQRLFEQLENALGAEVELSTAFDSPWLWTDPEDAWVQSVYDLLSEGPGTRPEPKAATYFTDASALKQALGGAPTVILGPGEPVMAHQSDEYCRVANILRAVDIYEAIATRWCLPTAGS